MATGGRPKPPPSQIHPDESGTITKSHRQRRLNSLIRTIVAAGFHFRVSIALLVMAAATGTAAFLLIPLRPDPTVPQAFAMFVGLDPNEQAPSVNPRLLSYEIYVSLHGASAGNSDTERSYDVTTRVALTPSAMTAVEIDIDLTIGTLENCPGRCMYKSPSRRTARTLIPLVNDQTGLTSNAEATFGIRARSFAFTSNGHFAVAELPTATFLMDANPGLAIAVQYDMPDANTYEWSSGPVPSVTLGKANWYLAPGGVPGAYGSVGPLYASGTNRSAQSREQLQIFIAGALIGIAGGALIGAIQEALRG